MKVTLLNRKLHRLKGYDYGQDGFYYVTICTNNKSNVLCNIVGNDALVVPSAIGERVIACWHNIEKLNKNITVDKFILMPNHIHGILAIQGNEMLDPKNKKYGFEVMERRGRRSLQGLIKDFKSVTTRHYKKLLNGSDKILLWQDSYYDEVIKNEEHYQNI